MKQRRYNLPGHYITIRLNNQPLAQWLLEQKIAIPPDTTGVRYACRASELGAMEIRVGWEEMRELGGLPNSGSPLPAGPGGQAGGFGGGFAVGGRPAGLPGDGYPGDLCGAAPRHGLCHQLV